MLETKQTVMIEFHSITPKDRARYEAALFRGEERGCEVSFSNVYLWGNQKMAVLHGHLVLLSQFGNRFVYPYPIGEGEKKAVLDAIIADAKARGIPCCITGLNSKARETVEMLYPRQFHFVCDEGSFDYVYAIDDLADLKGKPYDGKRNHLNRFREAYPDHTVQPLSADNMERVRWMVADWYRTRREKNPDSVSRTEQAALGKALDQYSDLGLEGLALCNREDVLAVTVGSPMSPDTFDVHFEKARADVQGAYAAINCEFARYIRAKHPHIRFLNREEDMGIEGLRRAKQSYHPHHRVKKYRAHLLEDGYEN